MPLHVFELLGPGADFGARFTYEIQDEAGGITQELGLAEGLADEEDGGYPW
jgi:glucose-1-phosphate thymidylyltransferase